MQSKEELPATLQALKIKGDDWQCPDEAYFNTMAEQAMMRANQPPIARRLLTNHRLAIAASILLLLLAGWWLKPGIQRTLIAEYKSTAKSEELLAEIALEEIDAYVTEQIDEFTQELYDEVLPND